MTHVTKRDCSTEPLDVEKIHQMIEKCSLGLRDVSVSEIAMRSHIQFYEGIKTEDIQKIVIQTAVDLISQSRPQFQILAARLLLTQLRKSIWGTYEVPSLLSVVRANAALGFYDSELEETYTEREWAELSNYVRHSQDEQLTWAGLKKLIDTYLVKNRHTGQVYETPQIMYMLVAATTFQRYPQKNRLSYVKRYYDAISTHKIAKATPQLAGLRTPTRQYSSCVLVRTDDTLPSQLSSLAAIGTYVSQKAGIGQEFGAMRGIGAPIRSGEVIFTGAVGYVKAIQAMIGYCSQGGLRKGSATLSYPIWHIDVESFLPLKNNKGLEENRARFLDYAVAISKLFLVRYQKKETVTLFDPGEAPELYAQYGLEGWDELYLQYEARALKGEFERSRVVSAKELLDALFIERAETGRIYILFIDHANSHSSFTDKIWQSNLCMEVTLPTAPFQHLSDPDGEIATCTLAAYNVLAITDFREFEELADLEVRALNEVMDIQNYPFVMSENATRARRPIGIGLTNWAALLAKKGLKWSDPETKALIHRISEAQQYFSLKASCNLARESGQAPWFGRTKYARGLLPIDTYKPEVDQIGNFPLEQDWESLRRDIAKYGLKNSTVTCQMPTESSSVVYSGTNGIEAPRAPVQVKGGIKTLVPGCDEWNYEYQWGIESNRDYIEVCALNTKFIDQSISADFYYNPYSHADERVPLELVVSDIFYAYKLGLKALYYHVTYDGNESTESEEGCLGGCKL